MLFWSRTVSGEWEGVILCSVCRRGPWITLRTSCLTRFPCLSTSTGTLILWRSTSRGWRPVRRTEPGSRVEEASERSCEARGPQARSEAETRAVLLGCVSQLTCAWHTAQLCVTHGVGSVLTAGGRVMWSFLSWGRGRSHTESRFFFLFWGKKSLALALCSSCNTQWLLCIFQAVKQQLYFCHRKINGTRSLLPVLALHYNGRVSWAWGWRDVTVFIIIHKIKKRRCVDLDLTMGPTFKPYYWWSKWFPGNSVGRLLY